MYSVHVTQNELSQVMRKWLMPYANNKGADQPAHLRTLVSTFVVCCLDSTIQFAMSKVSRPSKFLQLSNPFEFNLVANSQRQVFPWRGLLMFFFIVNKCLQWHTVIKHETLLLLISLFSPSPFDLYPFLTMQGYKCPTELYISNSHSVNLRVR